MAKKKIDIQTHNFFLSDRALSNATQDEFDHNTYAILLEDIIKNQETPFNIGIFGKWGVGKSTIVNLLKERFEKDNKYKFFEIKVWKYEQKSLRRKFIVNIAQNLGLDINDLYKDIYHDKEYETALINFNDILRTFFNKNSVPLWSLVGSISLFGIISFINFIGFSNPYAKLVFEKLEDGIVFPIILSILWWIWQVFNKAKMKIRIGKYDSVEQFENKFIELVKEKKEKKIIFIDDLDRCSKEKVVDTLETIKTFLDVEGCIFIIACDDEIIKESINNLNIYETKDQNDGSEYLEKFFQYTITVPPFMIPDMRKFVKNLLIRQKHGLTTFDKKELDEIIFILINRNVNNPRNAITIINNFSAAYLLAKQREEDKNSRMHSSAITKNLRTLAVIICLKVHFQKFYNALFINQDILFSLLELIKSKKDDLDEDDKKFLAQFIDIERNDNGNFVGINTKNSEGESLIRFLEFSMAYLNIRDIKPFLYLSIDTTSYQVGDEYLEDLNYALKDGIQSEFQKILEKADASRLESIFDQVNVWINEQLADTEKRKALQVLSKNFSKCPESRLHETCTTFYRNIDSNLSYEEFQDYSIGGLFVCAASIRLSWKDDLISRIIRLLKHDNIEFENIILEKIFENENLITSSNHQKIISKYIDDGIEHLPEDEVDDEENYVTSHNDYYELIIQFENNINVLNKFFSGDISNYLVDDLLSYEEELEEIEEDEDIYKTLYDTFHILKKNIIENDTSKLVDIYSKLIATSSWYKIALKDYQSKKSEIPKTSITKASESIIFNLSKFEDLEDLDISYELLSYWYRTHKNFSDKSIKLVKDNIIGFSKNDDNSYYDFSIKLYDEFKELFSEEDLEEIHNRYIETISISRLESLRKLVSILENGISQFTDSNKQNIINRISDQLHHLDNLRNEEYYILLKELLYNIEPSISDEVIQNIINPVNPQNIFHYQFNEANLIDRSNYWLLILPFFARLQEDKQLNFLKMNIDFLNSEVGLEVEYALDKVFSIYKSIKIANYIYSIRSYLIRAISKDIHDKYKKICFEILFSVKDQLDNSEIEQALSTLDDLCNEDPDYVLNLIILNWESMEHEFKIGLISKTISNEQDVDKSKMEKIKNQLSDEINNYDSEEIPDLLNEMAEAFKEDQQNRTFFANLLDLLNMKFTSEMKNTIRKKKIKSVEKQSEINLARNWFTIIIKFKSKNYEKDESVIELFSRLLNSSKAKKKLAIDNFEYYFDHRIPYGRKGELTERFNALLGELKDDYYKIKIYELGKKYNLKLKKKFFQVMKDFID